MASTNSRNYDAPFITGSSNHTITVAVEIIIAV